MRTPKQITAGFGPFGIVKHIAVIGNEHFSHRQTVGRQGRELCEDRKHLFVQNDSPLLDVSFQKIDKICINPSAFVKDNCGISLF